MQGFSSDELLIFIGHSDDASAEAQAIWELQTTITEKFRRLLEANGHHSFYRSVKFWKWQYDAAALTGGQDVVVTPALDQARIALFVFRERVGRVTRDELDRVRGKDDRVRILAFFPKRPVDADKLADAGYAVNWAELMQYKQELTSDWTASPSRSVTPCCAYTSKEELVEQVCDKIEQALAALIGESPINLVQNSVLLHTSATALLHLYQATLMRQLGNMTLTGSPALEHFATRLSDTFVSLSLSGSVRSETRFCKGVEQCDFLSDERSRMPEQVMKVVLHEQNHPLLLIIGDPGSGKTTLLKH